MSRGELVEIGGGVRIPEIVRRAGARLVEVGTTNRTRAADFEALADGRARVVLRVHPSNFRQDGFMEAPDPRELADAAHAHGAIVIDDLGSGALLDTAAFGLAHEPTPAERLAAGADLVTFSGDKLVGGPQAGLVVGPRRPRRADPQGPAGARGAARQGDARRGRGDARALSGRASPRRDPRLAADRGAGRRRCDARAVAIAALRPLGARVAEAEVHGRRRLAAGRDAASSRAVAIAGASPDRLARAAAGGRRRRSSAGSRTGSCCSTCGRSSRPTTTRWRRRWPRRWPPRADGVAERDRPA